MNLFLNASDVCHSINETEGEKLLEIQPNHPIVNSQIELFHEDSDDNDQDDNTQEYSPFSVDLTDQNTQTQYFFFKKIIH